MTTSTGTDPVQVQTRGDVLDEEIDYATQKIVSVLRFAGRPVLHVRVRLTRLRDPALERPAVVQVNLDLDGRLVRAQAGRPTMQEAVDEVHERLRDQLRRAAQDWEAIRGRRPSGEPHEWRHDSVPTQRAPYFPRGLDERQVVRHKTFSLPRITVDEAVFDLELCGYEFQLFSEDGTGVDSVIYRTAEPGAYRLSQLDPQPDTVVLGAAPVTLSGHHAPQLSALEAADRLEVTGWPFVFFRNAETGRGCVLYHRYDGHYGLIEPAD